MSASAGLDFIDDGRAIAVTDWDRDGDLDFWTTQRNGPRLRFIRNDVSRQNNHLTLELEGVLCNRDAIGARASLTTSTGRTLVRSVRAGDSFLSQSSKTLHFGLLAEESIQGLVVSWPGSQEGESFSLENSNGFFKLKQGAGTAKPHPEKARTDQPRLAASKPKTKTSSENRRLVLIRRPEAPEFQYVNFNGALETFPVTSNEPVLITLWASWCAPCIEELAALAAAHPALTEKQLNIIAISTDAITEGDASPNLRQAKALVARANYPFPTGVADTHSVQALTLILHNAFATQRPLPLPSSFLIDREGNVAVIYLGPLSAERLLKDIDLLDASPDVIEAASFPFPGENGIELFSLTPLAFAQAYQAGGYVDDARRSIEAHLPSATLKEQYFLGTLEQSQSNWEGAVAAYEKVLERSPNQPAIHVPLAVALWQNGKKEEAAEHFTAAGEHATEHPAIWIDLGKAHLQIGQPLEAVRFFKQAQRQDYAAAALITAGKAREGIAMYEALLQLDPEAHDVADRLAWTLATHPDAAIRNPERSLELADRLGALSNYQDPRVLDTLSAAQANAGKFDEAVRHATKALRLARAHGMTSLAQELQERLEHYQQQLPWRSQ